MTTESFDKNIIITEPEAIDIIVDVLLDKYNTRPVDRSVLSEARNEKGLALLRECLSKRTKDV